MLDHVLVPIASEDDATATADALRPYLADVERVTVVHVVEKGDGTIDKAPIAKRREDAASFLAVAESRLADLVAVDSRTAFQSNVADGIFGTARDVGATAIAFHARGGGRIQRLLSGDTSTRLVTDPELPVVSLPDPTDE